MATRCTGPACNTLATGLTPDAGTLSGQRNQAPGVVHATQHHGKKHAGKRVGVHKKPPISKEPMTDADVKDFPRLHEARSTAYKHGNDRITKDDGVRWALLGEVIYTDTKSITYSLLKQMVVIESGGKRDAVTPSGSFVGLFQMGKDACDTVKLDFDDVKANWRLNIRGGRLLAEKNIARMVKNKIEVTPLNVYMAHQQGYGSLHKLMMEEAGIPHTVTKPGNLAANVSKAFRERLAAAGQTLDEKRFYLYWQGIFSVLAGVVTDDPPDGPVLDLTVQQIIANKDFQIT